MKNWLLFLTITLTLGANTVLAQCTPDPNHTTELIYPSPGSVSYVATVDEYFEEVITMNIPADTTISIGPINLSLSIDSVVISSITGLPNGLSTACSPANCVFPGNSSGCTIISGTPTESGTFTIEATITVYATETTTGNANNLSDTYDYSLDVNPASIQDLKNIAEVKINQNPVVDALKIEFNSKTAEVSALKIYNIIGNVVYSSNESILSGDNYLSIPVTEFASGQYIITIETADQVISKKFNKQ